MAPSFAVAGVAVRHTDVWEHETFAEEQARWERSDPEYAALSRGPRGKDWGEEASQRAAEAKVEWDAPLLRGVRRTMSPGERGRRAFAIRVS